MFIFWIFQIIAIASVVHPKVSKHASTQKDVAEVVKKNNTAVYSDQSATVLDIIADSQETPKVKEKREKKEKKEKKEKRKEKKPKQPKPIIYSVSKDDIDRYFGTTNTRKALPPPESPPQP
jgi:hypothetical protein